MRFLFDTNVVSELRRSRKANPTVLKWAAKIDSGDTCISAITLMELRYGALKVRKADPVLANELARWINDDIRTRYTDRIIPVDDRVALQCADLIHPRTRAFADSLIAATALVHDLVVATRNVRDFEPMGVRFFNPWTD